MALGILAEAVLRLEHKLDLVLTALQFLEKTPPKQMHFVGNMCPVCKQLIDYQVDITHNVVTRKCGCKTGKQPSAVPLIPLTGVPNGNPSTTDPAAQARGSDGTENGPRRKGR